MKKGNEMERRDFLKCSMIAAGGGVASMVPGMALGAEHGSQGGTDRVKKERFKVIDYRCRPPLKQFGGLYKMRLGYIAQRPNVLGNPATHGKVPEAVKLFWEGELDQAFTMWWKEIDDTGIEAVVVAGRVMLGQPDMSMGSKELLEYEKKYPGRFWGIAPIDIDQDVTKAIAQLEAILSSGIRGVTIEPGYRTEGGPTTIDDPSFRPLLEMIQDSGKMLQIQTGAFASPVNWNGPNEIWRMDNVMRQFPKLRLVLGHGGYPRITEALALALKWPTVTLSSDVYTFWPGGEIYQQNIEMLQDQFVYGSAYPFGNFDTTLEQTLALPLSDTVMEKYLYHNARRLLGLES